MNSLQATFGSRLKSGSDSLFSEAFSETRGQFLLVLPILLVCELALAGFLIPEEQRSLVCFYFPWVKNTWLSFPGLFSCLFLLGLFFKNICFLPRENRTHPTGKLTGQWKKRLKKRLKGQSTVFQAVLKNRSIWPDKA